MSHGNKTIFGQHTQDMSERDENTIFELHKPNQVYVMYGANLII